MEDWYRVTPASIARLGGTRLVLIYNRSMYKLLKTIFSDYEWLPWRFARLPKEALAEPQIASKVLSTIQQSIGFSDSAGWYRVSKDNLKKLKVLKLIECFGGLRAALQANRPDLDLDWEKVRGRLRLRPCDAPRRPVRGL